MAARLPTKRVMDHDRLEDALFGSSGDEVERFDRTILIWRMVVVFDELLSYFDRSARIRCDAPN